MRGSVLSPEHFEGVHQNFIFLFTVYIDDYLFKRFCSLHKKWELVYYLTLTLIFNIY